MEHQEGLSTECMSSLNSSGIPKHRWKWANTIKVLCSYFQPCDTFKFPALAWRTSSSPDAGTILFLISSLSALLPLLKEKLTIKILCTFITKFPGRGASCKMYHWVPHLRLIANSRLFSTIVLKAWPPQGGLTSHYSFLHTENAMAVTVKGKRSQGLSRPQNSISILVMTYEIISDSFSLKVNFSWVCSLCFHFW